MKYYPIVDEKTMKLNPVEMKCLDCWWQFLCNDLKEPYCPNCGSKNVIKWECPRQ